MRKRNFTSLEVLAEQVRKAELQIFASQCRAEVWEQNFTYLAVKAERKCGSGTSHFATKCRTNVRTWNFRSLSVKTERKRNFRFLVVKADRKCRSGTSVLWQSMQNRSVEAEFQIFNRQDRAEALGITGLNPFLGPSCRVKKSPSPRRTGPLGSFVPAVFGRDVCLLSESLSHVS